MLWLPGLDGTATLWGPLRDALGDDARDAELVRYAADEARYDALLEAIAPRSRPTLVVAESFGGPLAVRLAMRDPMVRGLVLIASFAVGPSLARFGSLLSIAPRPPSLALRLALLGTDAPSARVTELAAAIRAVPPRVIARRVEQVARVDVRAELHALAIPITWIVGRRDRLVPPPADVPGEIVTIDGPHLLAQTRAHEVATVVRRALRAIA